MNKNKKMIFNIFIFVFLVGLTGFIIFKDQSVFEIIDIIKSVNVEFVLIGILCMMLYLICEGINIGRTLKVLGEKSTFLKNLKYALIGFFFSGVTPAASGGQPMQIYYMYKEKIPVASSTLALLLNLTSMQITTISFAMISLIFHHNLLDAGLAVFFTIGILLNLSALALLIIGVFSKRLSKWLIDFAIKALTFFKVKNIESKKEKFENELKKYQESAVFLKANKKTMVKILLTTLVQFTLYYSVTYWTYRALGFEGYNAFQIITMQAMVFATVSGIPSPGAVGVTEVAFINIFKDAFPKNVMNSAALLNRGINFYLPMIVSGVLSAVNHLKTKETGENLKKINVQADT